MAKTVPENTVIFLRIMICISLIYTLSNPLMVANQATGKVRKYQAVCGSILLLILPISYICLKLGLPAYSVFIVHFIMESIAQIARMIMLFPIIGMNVNDYLKNIYVKIFLVVTLSSIIPILVYENLSYSTSRFFIVCIVCMLSVSLIAYTIGLSKNERKFIRSKINDIYHKKLHK